LGDAAIGTRKYIDCVFWILDFERTCLKLNC